MAERWMYRTDGGGVHLEDQDCAGLPCVPVVVVNPEDREQVEALRDAIGKVEHYSAGFGWEFVQGALRRFLNPPPSDPGGIGAVVEDESGERYIRCSEGGGDPWRKVGIAAATGRWYRYDDFRAVRVLSEGYTA